MTGKKPSTDLTESDLTKGEQTRQTITQAALALFTEQGYHGTSMRQIAESAGIALGGIYNHFGGKEDIFKEVTLAYHPIHQIIPALENAHGESVEEIVHTAAGTMSDTLDQRADFLNLMMIEVVEFRGQHFPEIFANMFPRALNFTQRLREKPGRLRDIPLQIMLAGFIGLVFSYYLFRQFFGSLTELGPRRQVLDQLMEIFLHGILADPPGEEAAS